MIIDYIHEWLDINYMYILLFYINKYIGSEIVKTFELKITKEG